MHVLAIAYSYTARCFLYMYRCEMLQILEHSNYTHGLDKVREELNKLNFQVKAQVQLKQSTALKQTLLNLPNDGGIYSYT